MSALHMLAAVGVGLCPMVLVFAAVAAARRRLTRLALVLGVGAVALYAVLALVVTIVSLCRA